MVHHGTNWKCALHCRKIYLHENHAKRRWLGNIRCDETYDRGFVHVIKLDPTPTDSTGTGLRCTSSASAKHFVFVYDHTDGLGRPITGSFIESDGSDNGTTNSHVAFYGFSVNAVSGAFGVMLPNALPNGIRRIERRSLTDCSIISQDG